MTARIAAAAAWALLLATALPACSGGAPAASSAPAPEAASSSAEGQEEAPANGAETETPDAEATPADGAAQSDGETKMVCTDATYAPFEWEEDDGSIVGFDVDLMNAIAANQGMKIQYKNVPWDGIYLRVQNGECDYLISASTITDERKQVVSFSEPYYQVTQVALVPKGKSLKTADDLKSFGRIGVVNSQTSDLELQKVFGPTSDKIARYDSLPLVFKELIAGGVEALVADSAAVAYYAKENKDEKLNRFEIVNLEGFPKEDYGIAARIGDDAALAKINAGLKALRENGERDKIDQRYFPKRPQ